MKQGNVGLAGIEVGPETGRIVVGKMGFFPGDKADVVSLTPGSEADTISI